MDHLCGTCEYICTVDNCITLTFHSVSAPFYTEQFDHSSSSLVCSMVPNKNGCMMYRCVGTEQFEQLWNDYALANSLAYICSTRREAEKMHSTYKKQHILHFEHMSHKAPIICQACFKERGYESQMHGDT